MNTDDSLLVHLGNVAAILVFGLVYVLLLALGTALTHAVSRSATTATSAVTRVFARNRSA